MENEGVVIYEVNGLERKTNARRKPTPMTLALKVQESEDPQTHSLTPVVSLLRIASDTRKEYPLEQIKCIDGISPLLMTFALILPKKTFHYTLNSINEKIDFLSCLVECCKKFSTKKPELKNLDEIQLREKFKSIHLLSEFKGVQQNRDIEIQENEEDMISPFDHIDWDVGDAAALEKRLFSELIGLEAANVHAVIQCDDEILSTLSHVNEALSQLDTLDTWLENFSKRLQKMGQDIKKIEKKNNNMQRQTINRKNLLVVVEELLNVIDLPENVIKSLKEPCFETNDDLNILTSSAISLQQTLNFTKQPGCEEFEQMKAVNDQLNKFRGHRDEFSRKFSEHLEGLIDTLSEKALKDKSLKKFIFDQIKSSLIPYTGLTTWLKDMDPTRFSSLLTCYQKHFGKVYKKKISTFIDIQKQTVDRGDLEEIQDFVFVSVSSSTTFQTSLKSSTRLNMSTSAGINNARLGMLNSESNAEFRLVSPAESFRDLLETIVPMVENEEELIISFFSLEQDPTREGFFFKETRTSEGGEITSSKKVEDVMMKTFDFLNSELVSFINYSTKNDSTQCISILGALDKLRREKDIKSFYMKMILENLEKNCLSVNFKNFINDQLKDIQNVKINPKKRSGVLTEVKKYQNFVAHLESLIDGYQSAKARELLDFAYQQVADQLFFVLNTLGKSIPELEPKEVINSHIIITENCKYFENGIKQYKVPGLQKYTSQAKQIYDKHLLQYVRLVIHEPFGKLMEYFEGIDKLLLTRKAEEIVFQMSFNKNAVKKIISQFPPHVIQKGVESLYKRVNKHYSEEAGLFQVVWGRVQTELFAQYNHFSDIINKCYPNSDIKMEFTESHLVYPPSNV